MLQDSSTLHVLTTNNFDVPSPGQSARELHHCAVSSCAGCSSSRYPYIIYHHLPVLTPCSSSFRPFSSCRFLSLSNYSASCLATGYLKTEHKSRVVCLQKMACRAVLPVLQWFASASVVVLRRHGAYLGTIAECVPTNLHYIESAVEK